MGSGQSATDADSSHGRPSRPEAAMKVDYYELLEVDPSASEEDIKKAYRRKALLLHPDRNYGDVETATQLFSEVQAAYEVLSDPQERAWYDSHKDAILRGDEESTDDHYEQNIRVTTNDDIFKVFAKFDGHIDLTDSPNGFYNMIGAFFSKLDLEEEVGSQQSQGDITTRPSFGTSMSSYEHTVLPFYKAWSSFATAKTFSWKDIYKYSEAPDRRVRRAMEKENKKRREDSVREFNENIRLLVSFLRKRDPRIRANAPNEASRQKFLRDAAAAQAARSRAQHQAKLANHVEPTWSTGPDQEVVSSEDESEDVEQVIFECVVCGKSFKSEKQFEAHERSKKHVKALASLKRQIRKDNAHLDLNGESREGFAESANAEEPDAEELSDSNLSTEPKVEDTSADVSLRSSKISLDVRGEGSPTLAARDDSEDVIDEAVLEASLESKVENLDLDLQKSKQLEKESQATEAQPKIGKAKAKRAKKAEKQRIAKAKALKLTCVACGDQFPSKTKLFQHIKDLNHAQATVPKSSSSGKV